MDNLNYTHQNNTHHTLPIIGYHRSPLIQKFGTPRQPNLVDIKSQIVLCPPYDAQKAFVGIEQYSHLWLLWQFHHNTPQRQFRPQVRPPRLGGNDKLGVFATRSMYRPSAVGLSVVRLDTLQTNSIGQEAVLHIIGADMIDGTPILDIKPYLPYSDSVQAISPISTPHTKSVVVSQQAKTYFDELCQQNILTKNDFMIIQNLIAQDPRVAYRQHEVCVMNVMRYGKIDVAFFMNDMTQMVIDAFIPIKA